MRDRRIMGSQLTRQETRHLEQGTCMAQAYRNSRRSKQLKRHGRRRIRREEKLITEALTSTE